MDNSKSSDLMKENLLKIIIGDEVGSAMLTTLLQFGLIQHKPSVTEHGYELTPKGLDRLNGI
jgi:RIO-like serine/threonine protein kinase